MYGRFAQVYDYFMAETPYEAWVTNVCEIWRRHGKNPALVLELGCGTGSATVLLAGKGIEMIGVDMSSEMLAIASEKARLAGVDILYLCQDMRNIELYGTVDAVVSICDAMNYILTERELLGVFRLVRNYLEPGGIFVFDMNTAHKFQNILASNSFSELADEAAYIWENFYDSDSMINEYNTCFFIKRDDGLYERHEETHYQAAYQTDKVLALLIESGLTPGEVLDTDTMLPAVDGSERIYYTATKEN